MKKFFFLLPLILVALPFILRFSAGIHAMPGSEAYYHVLDDYEFSDSINTWEPYHFIAGPIHDIFGTIWFLPGLFTLASFALFWLLLSKLKLQDSVKFWSLLVFSLSPSFISAGYFANRAAFVLFCILLGSYLLLTRVKYAGMLFFGAAALSGIVGWLAALVFTTVLYVLFPECKGECKASYLLFFVALVLFPFPPVQNASVGIAGIFGDLGGLFGISIFVFLLLIVGASVLWSHKGKYYFLFVVFLALFLTCYFVPELLLFASIFASVISGFALSWLSRRKWDVHFLRDVSLLVLFCGLLFTTVSHISSIAYASPTDDFFGMLEGRRGVIFTHPDYGFWIEYSGAEVVADPFTHYLPDSESRLDNMDLAFHTNDLKDLVGVLKHYNVSYVLITDEMTDGLVWSRTDIGMDYLVSNRETFKLAYEDDHMSLWRVI